MNGSKEKKEIKRIFMFKGEYVNQIDEI